MDHVNLSVKWIKSKHPDYGIVIMRIGSKSIKLKSGDCFKIHSRPNDILLCCGFEWNKIINSHKIHFSSILYRVWQKDIKQWSNGFRKICDDLSDFDRIVKGDHLMKYIDFELDYDII